MIRHHLFAKIVVHVMFTSFLFFWHMDPLRSLPGLWDNESWTSLDTVYQLLYCYTGPLAQAPNNLESSRITGTAYEVGYCFRWLLVLKAGCLEHGIAQLSWSNHRHYHYILVSGFSSSQFFQVKQASVSHPTVADHRNTHWAAWHECETIYAPKRGRRSCSAFYSCKTGFPI